MIRIKDKKKLCIICEGYEEYEYLDSLIKLDLWSNYDIKLINAKSNGNLSSSYQYYYQNDDYDLILVFADTDRPNYSDFKLLLTKLNDFHAVEGYAEQIVIFGNPCTMQIILNHFSDTLVEVMKSNKKKNRPLILELTGVDNYDAHDYQRKLIFDQINLDNYKKMKDNLSNCSTSFEEVSSTNFLCFAEYFESSSYEWVEELNELA